jgi:hypothetical protein
MQHYLLPRTTADAGFNSRILTMLGTLVDTCLDPSQLKIYMTGECALPSGHSRARCSSQQHALHLFGAANAVLLVADSCPAAVYNATAKPRASHPPQDCRHPPILPHERRS